MMINVRKANQRGHANYGWLDTFHTFSFNTYYDPKFMGFHSLRVINEDFIEPAQGFPMHGHRDMEIVTYIIRGELSHKDSMGNGTTILPDEVQRMTAGRGIRHSEFSSPTEQTHLLQIWIMPEAEDLEPGYEQTSFPRDGKRGKLKLVASRAGTDGSVTINQDVSIYASVLANGERVEFEPAADRHVWIQLISGSLEVNGETLDAGDGAAISDERALSLRAGSDETEFLLFDLN